LLKGTPSISGVRQGLGRLCRAQFASGWEIQGTVDGLDGECGRRWGGWLESRAKLGPRIERLKAGEKETPDSHWQCPATHTHAIKMTTDEPGNHAPARPRIAIVGPPAAGKRALVAGLTGRAAPSTTTPPLKYPWVIDTKYYEAAVDLVCVRVGGERGGRGGRGDAAAVAVDEEAAQTGLEAAAAEQRAARARVGAADGRAGAAVAALGAAVAALGAEEVTIDDAATAMTASRAGVAQAGRPMRAGVHEPAPPGEAVAPQAHPTASSSSAPTPLSAAAPAEAVVLIFDGGDEASFEVRRDGEKEGGEEKERAGPGPFLSSTTLKPVIHLLDNRPPARGRPPPGPPWSPRPSACAWPTRPTPWGCTQAAASQPCRPGGQARPPGPRRPGGSGWMQPWVRVPPWRPPCPQCSLTGKPWAWPGSRKRWRHTCGRA